MTIPEEIQTLLDAVPIAYPSESIWDLAKEHPDTFLYHVKEIFDLLPAELHSKFCLILINLYQKNLKDLNTVGVDKDIFNPPEEGTEEFDIFINNLQRVNTNLEFCLSLIKEHQKQLVKGPKRFEIPQDFLSDDSLEPRCQDQSADKNYANDSKKQIEKRIVIYFKKVGSFYKYRFNKSEIRAIITIFNDKYSEQYGGIRGIIKNIFHEMMNMSLETENLKCLNNKELELIPLEEKKRFEEVADIIYYLYPPKYRPY